MSNDDNGLQAYVVNGKIVAIGTKKEINELAIDAFVRYINTLKVIKETEKQLMESNNEER